MARWLFLWAWLLPCAAYAEEGTSKLRIDPARTSITFQARTTFHEFAAIAPGATGSLVLRDGKPVAGEVSIPSDRIRTGVDSRDETMRSGEFLDAKQFPAVQFQLSSLEGPAVPPTGEASGTVHGVLRIRTVAREITSPVTYKRDGDRLEVSGAFPLDIRDFGLPVPVVFLVQRMEPVIRIDFVLSYGPEATP